MTGLLGRLFAVAEAYPELKANTELPPAAGPAREHRGRAAGRAALLQRDGPRPEFDHPELPAGADRAADGLHRGAVLPGRRPGDPKRAESVVRPPGGLTVRRAWRALSLPCCCSSRRPRRTPTSASSAIVSDVQIQKDSSLEVTETIDVHAENDRINHGIYRDFPTRYRGPHGSQVRVGFTFEGATLDGCPSRRAPSPFANGVRIKVGDAEQDRRRRRAQLCPPLPRRRAQIGRFAGYDELYWNATGNGWIFPIDVAEARIRLPVAGQASASAPSTPEPQGSTASNARGRRGKAGRNHCSGRRSRSAPMKG